MSQSNRLQAFQKMSFFKIGAVLLALASLVFAAACKKKVAAAPPPPVARTEPPPAIGRPTINSFTAEPSTISRGQSSTLRWSVTNATDMTIDHGVGAVNSQG